MTQRMLPDSGKPGRFFFSAQVLKFCLLVAAVAAASSAIALDNIFFLHHSTGRYLINEGDVREWIVDYNADNGTTFEFWDHDYNYIGLRDPDGENTGISYDVPGDNTDPVGLHTLWTTENDARDLVLADHEVIGFKSCYPASAINSPEKLQQYKTWYLEMRDVFDNYPDKLFIVMSTPPLHRLVTDTSEADNARAFANWLSSSEYLAGHPNVVCFDFFDMFAAPDDGSDTRNMLRYEYERSHTVGDSHPSWTANREKGPVFAEFLVTVAGAQQQTAVEPELPAGPALSLVNHPNPFNPRTVIAFELAVASDAQLAVFDLQGHLLSTLVDGELPAGHHERIWNGNDMRGRAMPAGVYLYRLNADGQTIGRTMALVR